LRKGGVIGGKKKKKKKKREKEKGKGKGKRIMRFSGAIVAG
jgi:hypothetical protein